MTREEAIANLKMISAAFVEPVTKEQGKLIDDTFDMAINALEQEPKLRQALEQEKGAYNALVKNIQCADCISRQAVLEAIRKCHCEEWVKAGIGAPIEALQPVYPAEKVGHWEWVQYDGNPQIGNWHCSECRSIVIECVSKEKKGGIPLYKYCPQCGAKIE